MKATPRPARFWTITVLAGAAILTYLFATAPAPLQQGEDARRTLSTAEALSLMAHENDVTRTLFTKAIVGGGKKQGLRFDERWAEEDVIAGPLPALFLRGVADELSRSDVPLRLFLGSDFPIEKSNEFTGMQAEIFAAMRTDTAAHHFQDPTTGEFVSMFPDMASAGPCVSCHNDHAKTSKSDWQLGDIMGATTWAYPSDSVTTDEFMAMLSAYRSGVEVVWSKYLEELDGLSPEEQPNVGSCWPSKGLCLPSHAVLRDSIDDLSGPKLMAELAQRTATP